MPWNCCSCCKLNVAVLLHFETKTCTCAAGTGKTSLLEGPKGVAIDDDSTNSPSQNGLTQLAGTLLFELLEEKQVSSGNINLL